METISYNSDYDQTYIDPYPAIPQQVREPLREYLRIGNIDKADYDNLDDIHGRKVLNDIDTQQRYVRAYCHDEVNNAAYEAAALGVLKDMQRGINGQASSSIRAGEALGKYITSRIDDVTGRENLYIIGLLQDRERLAQLKDTTRSMSSVSVNQSHEQAEHLISVPTEQEWLQDPTIADLDSIYNAISSINIESFLIAATETLQKLNDHPSASRGMLDDIRFAEQYLSPIAEAIGFDALAQSLNSRAKELRLVNGGRGFLLRKADNVLSRVRNFDTTHNESDNTKTIVRDVTEQLFDTTAVNPRLPVDYSAENSTVYGDAATTIVNVDGRNVPVAWRFREKSRGSLAWKLYKAESKSNGSSAKMPMDIVGITAVIENNNEADQSAVFRQMVRHAYQTNDLTPHSAPTKHSPTHITGTKRFIDEMSAGLTDVALDIKQSKSDDDLHLGKITLLYHNVPIEVQCVSRHYRDSMQTGKIAHIIYKANAKGTMTDEQLHRWQILLQDLRRRRSVISDPGLVGSTYNQITHEHTVGNSERQAIAAIEQFKLSREQLDQMVGFVATESSGSNNQANQDA